MSSDMFFQPEQDMSRVGAVPSREWTDEFTPLTDTSSRGFFVRSTVSDGRLRWSATACLLVIAVFLARAFFLQIIKGDAFATLAEGNRLRKIPLPATRGIIFDHENIPLVKNAPSFTASLVKADLPSDTAALEAIHATLASFAVDEESWTLALAQAARNPYEPVTVAGNLTFEQATQLSVLLPDMPGVSVHVTTDRHYLPTSVAAQSLAHVLGYEGRISEDEFARKKKEGYFLTDRIGKTGVEAAMETTLRGTAGVREIEVDALGRERRIVAVSSPTSGTNVRLTIDVAAQAELERLLQTMLTKTGKHRASAIAIDPRDGSIRALVSLPAYDPNLFSGGVSKTAYATLTANPDLPLFSRAVSGQYPSGSTFKPVVAVAGLAEDIITPQTSVLSTGGIWYGKRFFFPDWKAGGHGATNVVKAIAESVNTFFYTIGGGTDTFKGLGPEKIGEYARLFGFGDKTGIDLPSEARGLIPTPAWKQETRNEQWYIGDTYHMAIGQGDVLASPLQVAVMTVALANGGTVWKPHVMDALSTDGKTWQTIAPVVGKDITNLSSAIAVVQKGMRATITTGSGRAMNTVPVPVSGKTGTAQFGNGQLTHAWFTGYAPSDAPTLTITILIEEGGEGSSVAVPVAKDFLTWYFTRSKNPAPAFSTSTSP